METRCQISIAVPVFNEVSVVGLFHERLCAVLSAQPGGPHEIVYVDDGSSDGTLELLESFATRDPRVVVVSLSRNFGHQAALSAAMDHASGDCVVLMDGDLQDEPELIPALLARYHEGFDVVWVRRQCREGSFPKRILSFFYYRMIRALTLGEHPLDSGDFSLMSRRAVDAIRAVPERRRYLRGLRNWIGFCHTSISAPRPERAGGTTKFGPMRLFGLAFDGVFGFSFFPLRLITAAGALVFSLGGTLAFLDSEWSSPVCVILTLGFGMQLLALGVVGEYVVRIHSEVKGRPLYIVQRLIGSDAFRARRPAFDLGRPSRTSSSPSSGGIPAARIPSARLQPEAHLSVSPPARSESSSVQ